MSDARRRGLGHDKTGQGASAFRVFLRGLPDDLARAEPIEMVFPAEPAQHRRTLLETLGVRVLVEPGVGPLVRRAGTQ